MFHKRVSRLVLPLCLALLLMSPGSLVLSQEEPLSGENPPESPTRGHLFTHPSGRSLEMDERGAIYLWGTPPALDHMAVETWGLCYSTDNGVTNMYADYVNSTLISFTYTWVKPNTLKVVSKAKTLDNVLKITNTILWKVKQDQIDITMVVKNISGGPVTLQRVKRFADINVDGSATNVWVRTDSTVFAVSGGWGVMLSAVSPLRRCDALADPQVLINYPKDGRKCFYDSSVSSGFIGDAAGLIAWWAFFDCASGKTCTCKVQYKLYRSLEGLPDVCVP